MTERITSEEAAPKKADSVVDSHRDVAGLCSSSTGALFPRGALSTVGPALAQNAPAPL